MSKDYVNVYSQPVEDLPDHIYKQLYNLNLRDAGCMRNELVLHRNSPERAGNGKVYYIKGRKDIIKGWALVFKEYKRNEVHFYVRASERKQGYGSILAQTVKADYKRKTLKGYADNSTIFKRHRIPHVWKDEVW